VARLRDRLAWTPTRR